MVTIFFSVNGHVGNGQTLEVLRPPPAPKPSGVTLRATLNILYFH